MRNYIGNLKVFKLCNMTQFGGSQRFWSFESWLSDQRDYRVESIWQSNRNEQTRQKTAWKNGKNQKYIFKMP